MFFTVYKGYEIVSSGDNFRVKEPTGSYIPEIAASVATAKKWIDAIYRDKVSIKRAKVKTHDPYAVDDFTRAYIECALWSSRDGESDENLDANHDITDIAPETHAQMVSDCRSFQQENAELLAQAYAMQYRFRTRSPDYTPSQAGHDFWLTRCGHGAGFWDRGLGDIGKQLTAKCGYKTEYIDVDLYIGDDGKIYQS